MTSRRLSGPRHRLGRGLVRIAVALLLCASLPAEAQDTRRPFRIGVINAAYAASHPTVEGLKAGLAELGIERYPPGERNRIQNRWVESRIDRDAATHPERTKVHVESLHRSPRSYML